MLLIEPSLGVNCTGTSEHAWLPAAGAERGADEATTPQSASSLSAWPVDSNITGDLLVELQRETLFLQPVGGSPAPAARSPPASPNAATDEVVASKLQRITGIRFHKIQVNTTVNNSAQLALRASVHCFCLACDLPMNLSLTVAVCVCISCCAIRVACLVGTAYQS